jgi:hypothetical protein
MPGIIDTVLQWASNRTQFISWGFNAAIKYAFPTLNEFKGLSDTQRDTFDTLTDENLKKCIKDGSEDNAKLILDVVKTSPKIETLFAKLDDVSHFDTLLKLSTEQIDTFLGINDDEVRKFAEGLAETKAKKLLDALKAHTDLGKLNKDQIETLTNIGDNDLFAHTITLAETDAKKLLDALKTTPELLHVWKVLETTKGDGATHLAKFLKLDSTEAKNYLDIITGKNDGTATATSSKRGNIKTKLVSLSDDEIKRFCSDFTTTNNNTNLNATLDYIDSHKDYLDYWALLPNATAKERASKELFLSIDCVKTSHVEQHVIGIVANTGAPRGGHHTGTLTYYIQNSGAKDTYIFNQANNIRFKPAQVQKPLNYDSTTPFPYTPPSLNPPDNIPAPPVEEVTPIEMERPNGTWGTKNVGSSMFPDTWSLKQIEAETALAYQKAQSNLATYYLLGNRYIVRDTNNTVNIAVCFGTTHANNLLLTATATAPIFNTKIKTSFPTY